MAKLLFIVALCVAVAVVAAQGGKGKGAKGEKGKRGPGGPDNGGNSPAADRPNCPKLCKLVDGDATDLCPADRCGCREGFTCGNEKTVTIDSVSYTASICVADGAEAPTDADLWTCLSRGSCASNDDCRDGAGTCDAHPTSFTAADGTVNSANFCQYPFNAFAFLTRGGRRGPGRN